MSPEEMYKQAEQVEVGDAIMVFSGSAHHRYTVSKVTIEGQKVTLELHQFGEVTYGRKHQLMLG